jgi:D-ribose pyranase
VPRDSHGARCPRSAEAEFQNRPIWQAEEFLTTNPPETIKRFSDSFGSIPLTREAHIQFKKRGPDAIGLIRTGDPTAYGNIIVESE